MDGADGQDRTGGQEMEKLQALYAQMTSGLL